MKPKVHWFKNFCIPFLVSALFMFCNFKILLSKGFTPCNYCLYFSILCFHVLLHNHKTLIINPLPHFHHLCIEQKNWRIMQNSSKYSLMQWLNKYLCTDIWKCILYFPKYQSTSHNFSTIFKNLFVPMQILFRFFNKVPTYSLFTRHIVNRAPFSISCPVARLHNNPVFYVWLHILKFIPHQQFTVRIFL